MSSGLQLSVWEHLDELRVRLTWAAGALVLGTVISVIFTKRALQLLIMPLAQVPQAIKPTESFVVYFQIALIGGVCLAMPMIVYQVIGFILPGLEAHEKKYLYFLVPGATVCFILGVAFAALIMLPAAINFMQSFMDTVIENQWTLENYISFVTRVLFWMGIVFQTPLVIFFLAKLHVVNAKQLKKYRKYAVLVIAIVAAMVTPTPDPINMAIVMIPLYLLYEVGIQLARIAQIGEPHDEPTTTTAQPA